jgi:hypothetical protein
MPKKVKKTKIKKCSQLGGWQAGKPRIRKACFLFYLPPYTLNLIPDPFSIQYPAFRFGIADCGLRIGKKTAQLINSIDYIQ